MGEEHHNLPVMNCPSMVTAHPGFPERQRLFAVSRPWRGRFLRFLAVLESCQKPAIGGARANYIDARRTIIPVKVSDFLIGAFG
jgi:hypothetical protein